MSTPDRNLPDPLAPVTRTELREVLDGVLDRRPSELKTDLLRELASKAEVEAMGRRLTMWLAGILIGVILAILLK